MNILKRALPALFLALLLLICLPALAEDRLRGYDENDGYVYLTMGEFPQTKEGGVEPILWRVLSADDERAYLVTEYILMARRIHPNDDDWMATGGDITRTEIWDYLNGEFFTGHFTPEEQALVLDTPDLGRMFLLSREELNDRALGFGTKKSRKAWGTEYALANGLFKYSSSHGKHSPYWTRTQSSTAKYGANCTKAEGNLGYIRVVVADEGCRPACYIDTQALVITGGSGTMADPFTVSSSKVPETPVPVIAEVIEVTATPAPPQDAPVATPAPEAPAADVSASTPAPVAAPAAQLPEAMDITAECTWKVSYSGTAPKSLTDGKYTSKSTLKKIENPWVSCSAPAGLNIHGLYLCFASMPESYEIQVDYGQGNGWEKYLDGDTRFYHVYVPLNGVQKVRVYCTQEGRYEWSFNEVFALSEGALPSWVQCWQPTPEKADILFLSTHPDDELIFFAGGIPTYAVEQGRSVVVAYMSYSNTTRRSELLNGLWSMGVRHYPVIGTFRDSFTNSAAKSYKKVGGQNKVLDFVVELYRKYKPEVVVTHDTEGEYGHGMHMMTADAARKAIALAANDEEFVDSMLAYGVWDVKKLYLHLYPEKQLIFDWDVPLQSMGGKTGLELAEEAYALHITQRGSGMSVTETGKEYDNRVFGLAYTAVGDDVRKDDFLENIYASPASYVPVTPTPAPTPAPTPVPAHVAVMPPLNEKGFLDEGEFIYSSEEQGLWIYVNQTEKVIINRRSDNGGEPLTWFEAEIFSDVEAGSMLNNYFFDPEKKGKVRRDASETAKKHHLPFAMNADYFTYRVGSKTGRHIGVVVRGGEILYDDRLREDQVTDGLFPNLDMLAFYRDGSMDVYHSYDISAQDMIDQGAYTVLSFGPYLIKDGEFSERVYTSNDSLNPRAAIGMVEPGHYVAIMAEGRLKRSSGITMQHLAKLMKAKGCQVAFNLDGGQTAVMCFMGKQLNMIGKYDGGKTNARKTSEVIGIGYSEQVGVYEVDVINK